MLCGGHAAGGHTMRRAVKHPLAMVIGVLIVGCVATVSLSQTRQTVADLKALAGTWEGVTFWSLENGHDHADDQG